MAGRAYTPCTHPACGALVQGGGRCPDHAPSRSRQFDGRPDRRASAAARGYGRRWRKARAAYLLRNPLCVGECRAAGRLTPASVVDHIVDHHGDPRLFWGVDNWQALCKRCHDRKTYATRVGSPGAKAITAG